MSSKKKKKKKIYYLSVIIVVIVIIYYIRYSKYIFIIKWNLEPDTDLFALCLLLELILKIFYR
ncbi:hypothetical protein C2G38_2105245 [Gigaspora rosea]|uniref:Uncharacterized protein n=1 Tax=Gigaspora rosea TaxID=44941 RepID=A0A397UKX4_9GLOM|nr:hypothetical protein C2G38_2105245 [Gigaspora rosea]